LAGGGFFFPTRRTHGHSHAKKPIEDGEGEGERDFVANREFEGSDLHLGEKPPVKCYKRTYLSKRFRMFLTLLWPEKEKECANMRPPDAYNAVHHRRNEKPWRWEKRFKRKVGADDGSPGRRRIKRRWSSPAHAGCPIPA